MKAEVAQQRSLLELSKLDAELSRLTHRAAHLPEQETCRRMQEEYDAAGDRQGAVRIALEDIDAHVKRLESEIDAVRQREDRDRALLQSGATDAKQLADLQHELETLQRRQTSLEDSLLEVMNVARSCSPSWTPSRRPSKPWRPKSPARGRRSTPRSPSSPKHANSIRHNATR